MWVAGLHRRSGISPRLEDNFLEFSGIIIRGFPHHVKNYDPWLFRGIASFFHYSCYIKRNVNPVFTDIHSYSRYLISF